MAVLRSGVMNCLSWGKFFWRVVLLNSRFSVVLQTVVRLRLLAAIESLGEAVSVSQICNLCWMMCSICV